jgi:hypothetical protein
MTRPASAPFTYREPCIGDGSGHILVQEKNHQGSPLPISYTEAEVFLTPYSFGVMYDDVVEAQSPTCDYLLTPLARLQAAEMVRQRMRVLFVDRSRLNPSVNTPSDVGSVWIHKGDAETMLRLQVSFSMTEPELIAAFELAKSWRPSDESLLGLWFDIATHQKAAYVLELHRFERQFEEKLLTRELMERIGPQWMQFAK